MVHTAGTSGSDAALGATTSEVGTRLPLVMQWSNFNLNDGTSLDALKTARIAFYDGETAERLSNKDSGSGYSAAEAVSSSDSGERFLPYAMYSDVSADDVSSTSAHKARLVLEWNNFNLNSKDNLDALQDLVNTRLAGSDTDAVRLPVDDSSDSSRDAPQDAGLAKRFVPFGVVREQLGSSSDVKTRVPMVMQWNNFNLNDGSNLDVLVRRAVALDDGETTRMAVSDLPLVDEGSVRSNHAPNTSELKSQRF